MAATHYIVDPSNARAATCNLLPGLFRAKVWDSAAQAFIPVPVLCEIIEDRDPETGDLMSDVIYRLIVDGWPVTDWDKKYGYYGLAGDPISQVDYDLLVDLRERQKFGGVPTTGPDAPRVDGRTKPLDVPPTLPF